MATWPANSDTDWNTKMLAYLAIEHNTDGTHKDAVKSPFSALTLNDSESNAMLKAHAYLAATDGFIHVNTVSTDGKVLRGYIGATTDPAGAGSLVQVHVNEGSGLKYESISFSVAKDEYFEITYDGTQAPSIFWRSVGTLSSPVDQD